MTNILHSLGFGSANSILTAALLLRVTLGALFLAHAWLKVFVFTPAGAAQYFASLGVPGFVAYLTIAAELLRRERPSHEALTIDLHALTVARRPVLPVPPAPR